MLVYSIESLSVEDGYEQTGSRKRMLKMSTVTLVYAVNIESYYLYQITSSSSNFLIDIIISVRTNYLQDVPRSLSPRKSRKCHRLYLVIQIACITVGRRWNE